MARYVDGFVAPVPTKNLKAYRRMAQLAGIWRAGVHRVRHRRREAGKLTSFPQSVKLKPDEIVVFSWIVYKSRKHRDSINAKVMKDPRLAR